MSVVLFFRVNSLQRRSFILPLSHYHQGYSLFLTTKLKAPSESEEVDELQNAEETESRAETNQAAEGRYEILNGIEDVLVVLHQAVILEVDVEQRQVSISGKILNNLVDSEGSEVR